MKQLTFEREFLLTRYNFAHARIHISIRMGLGHVHVYMYNFFRGLLSTVLCTNFLNIFTIPQMSPLYSRNKYSKYCCIIGQQTNVDWNALVSLVSNETNTDVRMYT